MQPVLYPTFNKVLLDTHTNTYLNDAIWLHALRAIVSVGEVSGGNVHMSILDDTCFITH